MTNGEIAGASRPTRRLTLVSVAVWLLLALALPLGALTLNAVRIAGFPLGFWVAAQGSLIGLATLAWVFAWRAGGERAREGAAPSLAFASEAIASAGFIGFVGLIASLGFDGLSYPLGVVAGLSLLTILVAPRFVLYPVSTIGGFFTERFGGLWARRVSLAILGVASVFLLAADLRGAGLAIQALTDMSGAISLAMAASLLSAVWLAASFTQSRRPIGLFYGFLLLAFLAPLAAVSWTQGRFPIPHLFFGFALEDVARLEQGLIEKKLADFRALKPLTSPFLQLPAWNFAGVVLGLALGLAALPQLLGRHLSRAAVAPGEAPRRAATAVAWVAAFLSGLVVYATLSRHALASFIDAGVKTAELPSAVTHASGLGWIDVCGVKASSAAELAAACSKMSGHKGVLRLQDISFANDTYLFATASVARISPILLLLLAAGALVAALAAGRAILAGYLAADGEARRSASADRDAIEPRSVVLAAVLLLLAVWLATFGSSDIASLASEGLTLVAAGIFPALVLGLYWRRFAASGAVAAMVTGFAAAGLYVAGTKFFPLSFVDLTGGLSNAPPNAVRKLAGLRSALESIQDPVAYAAAQSEIHRHAQLVANWWGLKPGAAALFGLPAGFFAGVLTTLLSKKPVPE